MGLSIREIHGLKPLRKTNRKGLIRKYSVSVTDPGRKRGKSIKKGLTIKQAKSLAAEKVLSTAQGSRVRINYIWPGSGPFLVREFLITKEGSQEVYKKGMGPYLEGRKA